MKKRGLSWLLVFAMIFSLTSFSNVSADSDRVKELPLATDNAAELTAVNAVSISEVPNNIKNLISDQNADKIILASTPEDEAEIFTLRTINSETGEGTITVHSVPIKYRDSTGKMQFIDTSMKPINTAESAQNGFIYRNAANSFLVEFGNTASKGINFNNAFTFEAKSNISSRKAEQGQAENEQGKIIYPNVFGPNTKVEYINTENGLKENIILDKYTGQNRFDFTFRSDTHIPILTENGTNILVADKNDLQKIEYRFLSLYAYDSYDPAKDPEQRDSDFRHMNEDLYYELTDNEDGTYTITVVVPEEYLTHPEIVYPVTVDPSLEPYVSSNSNAQDTFVDAATPSTQGNGNLDYIRFGKVSGYKNFGYHRFTSLPSLPQGAYATSAYLKFTFRSGQTTPSTSSGIRMRVRRVTGGSWNESSITWNTKPSTDSSTLVDITYKGSYLDYFNANITSMVQSWYAGASNYGVDFTYSNEDYNDYNSVVSSEGEAHRAPTLTINYVAPSPTSINLHTDYSGLIHTVGQVNYYTFSIPGNGGMITVETKGSTDTYGTVTIGGTTYTDDDSGEGRNFAIGFKMQSGQTATIAVRHYNRMSGTGSYTINIRRQRSLIHTFNYPGIDINTTGDAATPSSKLSGMGYLNYSRQNQSVSDTRYVDHTGYQRINSEVYMFSGHGNKGGVCFYDESWLWSSTHPNVGNSKLIVWSSCYSSTASDTEIALNQASINHGAKSAIGWPEKISDLSAPTFTDQLFTSLAEGKTVGEAAQAGADRMLFPWDNVKLYDIKGSTSTRLTSPVVQPKNVNVNENLITLQTLENALSQDTYVQYPLAQGGTRYYKTINGCLTNDYYDSYSNGKIIKSEQTITTNEIIQIANKVQLRANYTIPQTVVSQDKVFNKITKTESHKVFIKLDDEVVPIQIFYTDYTNDEGIPFQDIKCVNLNDNSLIDYREISVAK